MSEHPCDVQWPVGIVEQAADAIAWVDAAGRIEGWNRAAAALYGYAPEEIIGSPMRRLFPPVGASSEMLQRALGGERVPHYEVARVRRDGSVIVVGETLSTLRGADGDIVGAVAIAHDVTARSAVDAELRMLAEQLEEKNRQLVTSNRELEEFAYVASHDLQEPLRAVAGMVGLLARRYGDQLGEEADEFIALAVDGCTRMRRMIEDLLEFSRVGRGELRMTRVDVSSSLQRVLRVIEPQRVEASSEIVVDPLPPVWTDASQLELIFLHLLSNALKFRRPGVRPVVRVGASRCDGVWRCTVSDNGIGIDPRYADRIFRMFQRINHPETYPGTGIGLAVTLKVVERLGGTLGVAPNDRGGSTFWFNLPDPGDSST